MVNFDKEITSTDSSENVKCVENQSKKTSKSVISVLSVQYLAISLNTQQILSFPGIPGFPGNSYFPSRFPNSKKVGKSAKASLN